MPTIPSKTFLHRRGPHGTEIASIAEDSTGNINVTREQHLRMLRKAAHSFNNKSRSSSDSAVNGDDRSNNNNKKGSKHDNNRDRAHSDSSGGYGTGNVKSRLATFSKLVKGSLNHAKKHPDHNNHELYEVTEDDDNNNRTPRSNRHRRRAQQTDSASVSSSQMAGDNGSAHSSAAVESVANFTEASLDTVKVSNITEKIPSTPGGASGSGTKKSVVKQWNKFKRMMGVKPSPEADVRRRSYNYSDLFTPFSTTGNIVRDRTYSDDTKSSNVPDWRRVRSEASSTVVSNLTGRANPPLAHYNMDPKTKKMMDDSIRGRLDGIDIMSLGSAQPWSAISSSQKDTKLKNNKDSAQQIDIPMQYFTFTGKPVKVSNGDIVANMLKNSGGRDPPEIILDGICPGSDGRWIVRLEQSAAIVSQPQTPSETPKKVVTLSCSQQPTPPTHRDSTAWVSSVPPLSSSATPTRDGSPEPPLLQPSLASSSEGCDGSLDEDPILPAHILRKQLWGPETGPADLTNLEDEVDDNTDRNNKKKGDQEGNAGITDDPLLSLAARCSIPIDIDEDTFIISSRDHVQSIHEIASTSLTKGHFAVALRVFETLLKGLNTLKYSDSTQQTDKEESDLRFSKGATMNNIGLVHLWLGQYAEAANSFEGAVLERQKLLPTHHPDICVSLNRQAIALFALGRLEDAKSTLEQALAVAPADHVMQAKILNNLGVVYFQQNNLTASLKELTKSLDIQRSWLDSSIRRPTNLFYAAVTLCNMGKLYLERSDYDLSCYLYEEAVLLQTSIYRKDHETVLETLASLGVAKARHGEVEKGLQIVQGRLRSQRKKVNNHGSTITPYSADVIETIGLCGWLHAKLREYDDALQCMVQVRKWQKANLQHNHPSLRESKELIKIIEAVAFSTKTGNNNNSNAATNDNGDGEIGGGKASSCIPKVWI